MQDPVGFSRVFSAGCFHGPRKESVLRRRRIPRPETAAFPTDASDTFPSPAYLVAEIGHGLRLAYPVGKGSAMILPSMAPNSRRAIWLSASSSHKCLLCLINVHRFLQKNLAQDSGKSAVV